MVVILNNGTQIRIPRDMGQKILRSILAGREPSAKWHIGVSTDDSRSFGFDIAQAAAIVEEEDIIQPLNK